MRIDVQLLWNYYEQATLCIVRRLFLLATLGFGLLQGCMTVGPDYVPPDPKMPDAWHQELTKGLFEGKAALKTWWKALNDPLLDRLIERATKGNLDLKVQLLSPTIAAQSVTEAEAQFESMFFISISYAQTDTPTASALTSPQAESIDVRPGVRVPLRTGGTVEAALPMNRLE